ncbi:esterase-like activity of phytase family protein [Polycladidibacter stylochi]|uniref:esterase-like activity of phytase family protein n=1 Tax=Polycladidibacter stylochi TaxID=1807766 RepID=UPI00083591A7|nr:esterase-like activity of phytase family protein [Pseudovibrio stylochi]
MKYSKTFIFSALLFTFALVIIIIDLQPVWSTYRPDGQTIEITAAKLDGFDPDDTAETSFGKLTFLGGLELNSNERWFGGFSGLIVSPDGKKLTAVSDRALWFTADLVQAKNGAPLKLTNAYMEPMDGIGKTALASTDKSDTEALTVDGKGRLLVSYEGYGGILAYKYKANGKLAAPEDLSVPQDLHMLEKNKGIEALAYAPRGSIHAGSVFALSERSGSSTDDRLAYEINLEHPARSNKFIIKDIDGYDITDAAFLPNGDLIFLERQIGISVGLNFRMRRIAAKDIKPGAEVTGDVLLDVGMSKRIDNFEALAIHSDQNGDAILTLLSDDNHNMIQRTLLLRFKLAM